MEKEKLFSSLCEELSLIYSTINLDVPPYTAPSVPLFARLSSEQQDAVLANISRYTGMLRKCRELNIPLTDSVALAKMMLRELWADPCPSFAHAFDAEDGDIIEICGLENESVFRCMRTVGLQSYPIEEVYCREWWLLYGRDSKITQMLFDATAKIASGVSRKTTDLSHIPRHIVKELESPKRLSLWVQHKTASPARSIDGEVSYFTIVESIWPSDQERPQKKVLLKKIGSVLGFKARK